LPLADLLRSIDRDLADAYELLKFERDEIAHGLLPVRPLIATVAEEKGILESVLAAL
jgi:translation elongation factor EF-1beta